MKRNLFEFFRDDDGAVTVDWVVLTASIVALGVGLLVAIDSATSGLEGRTAEAITAADDSQID
jgi:hypothetical protein